VRYSFLGDGPAAEQGLEAGAFVKSRPGLEAPDLQFHFIVALFMDHGRSKPDRHGFMSHACLLRPESRGHIGLKSDDPFAAPLIQPNYLATDNDRRALRRGLRILREVFAQRAFEPYRGPELMPGSDAQSDSELDAYIRRSAETIYHPVGTCRMGADGDAMAVVDGELRVRGVAGLRVVDASVMPDIVGGNTNAPTIMIAEKAADMILGHAALPAEDVPIAENARHQERQPAE